MSKFQTAFCTTDVFCLNGKHSAENTLAASAPEFLQSVPQHQCYGEDTRDEEHGILPNLAST